MNFYPASPFEITRRDRSINASLQFTAPEGPDSVPRGFALGAHATDPAQFDVAQHNTFIGHLTRQVRVGVTSDTPVGVESPFTNGQEVTVEKAKEIEAEGSAYLVVSGVNAITANTPVGTDLCFYNGYLGVRSSGLHTNYILTANNLTPQTQGNLRIRAEFFAG